MSEKLQKVLARAGFGSRREIEQWISDGRLKINGQPAKLGDRVELGDRVQLDGKSVSASRLHGDHRRVLMYHKTSGTVCTRSDPEGRKTVFEDLPSIKGARWVLVGRLDISTSGLLLITSDGELANRLMHPSFEIEREYLVRVLGKVNHTTLESLKTGVELDDGPAHFESIFDLGGEGANHWYKVVVKEGRNREVRRLWESQGIQVSRLSRIRFGPVEIPKSLRRGMYKDLPPSMVQRLYKSVGLIAEQPRKKKVKQVLKRGRSTIKKAKPRYRAKSRAER